MYRLPNRSEDRKVRTEHLQMCAKIKLNELKQLENNLFCLIAMHANHALR